MLFVNLDVGSAIESSGNYIINKLSKNMDIFHYQTNEDSFFKYLLEKQPKTIIINGIYPRIVNPIIYYKRINPDIKIILISRDYNELFGRPSDDSFEQNYYHIVETFLKEVNFIFIVNLCNRKIDFQYLNNKIISCCGINGEDIYYPRKSWNKRKKDFIILGSLNDHKISSKFLQLLKETKINIDCYGNIKNQTTEFNKLFMSTLNLNYKGEVDWKNVPKILSEYKYYILPHAGYEPFCNSLQQAILCGCIPLCSFNENTDWYEWAKPFCFIAYDEKKLINNIQDINNVNEDWEQISIINRQKCIDYYSTEKIINILKNLIENRRI